MILGDVIRMVAITAVGYLSITGDLTLTILIVLVVIYGVGQAAFQPAFQAIVPDIVPEDLLVEANSLDQFVRPFAITLVGPMIGGLVIGAVGVGWAFLLDAGTFLWSAFAIWMIRTRRSDIAEERKESVWSDALAGLRYVARTRWLLVGMVAATLSLFAVWGPWESLVPFVVKNDLGGSAVGLGVVYAAGGVGSVSVALILGQRGKLPRRAMTWLYATWAFGMFATAGFGVVTQLWQAMLVALAAEASISALIVIWITVVQRLVPADLLGRVFSLDWMISITGVPLSFAFVGPLADSIGADATLILAGVVGGTVTLLFMLVPGARGPEQDGSLEAADPKAAEAPG
jgi:MFS family permease